MTGIEINQFWPIQAGRKCIGKVSGTSQFGQEDCRAQEAKQAGLEKCGATGPTAPVSESYFLNRIVLLVLSLDRFTVLVKTMMLEPGCLVSSHTSQDPWQIP